MFLGFNSARQPGLAGAALAAAGFALGVLAATTVHPIPWPQAPGSTSFARTPSWSSPAPEVTARLGYPAEVVRVLDGDTFEARVRVWPGIEISTKVRLLGIDAPEMRARCTEERNRAEAARDALSGLLARGGVTIGNVRLGKYGGRVLADVSTHNAANVAETLLAAGRVRRYGGGRRGSWCGT